MSHIAVRTNHVVNVQNIVEINNCRYGQMLAFSDDQVIKRSLELYGEWSEHEIDFLTHYITEQSIVLDVGANVGTHTLAFAKRCQGAMVFGFEPRPLVSSVAAVNCARNGATNAAIIQMACADRRSYMYLAPPLVNETNVGAYSLQSPPLKSLSLKRWIGGILRRRTVVAPSEANPFPPLQKIPVDRLDNIAFSQPVSLVKIDVEGMETQVLRGASRMIMKYKPTIYFETLSVGALSDSFSLLCRLDYELYWLETHQYNKNNYKQFLNNIWWKTELGVLALPRGVSPHHALAKSEGVPQSLPFSADARAGIVVLN